MNKLKSIIQYECMTSFKYIWIFYAIQYAIVGLITLIIGIVSGSFENVGTNCLEINTLFFVSILGALGFKEDFKTLIQNGFNKDYTSLYSGIYGYDNIVMNWLWLFLVYVMFCCLLYLTILIINKIGKTMSIYCGILFIGCIVLITALFRYVFSAELVKNILNFFMKAAGFLFLFITHYRHFRNYIFCGH